MALITRATRCAICGEGIGADGYFATSGVWLPPSHPLLLGSNQSLVPVRQLALEADVVLAIGTELGETDYDVVFDGNFKLGGELIRIDIDAQQLLRNHMPSLAIQSDARLAMRLLLADLPSGELRVDSPGARRTAAVQAQLAEDFSGWAHYRQLFTTVLETLPEARFVGDSTQTVYSGNHLVELDGARRWFNSSTGYGTLGYGLPAAIGAKLGAPDRPVVAMVGDGGLLFTLPELGTAIELELPLAILLWDNDGLGQIRDGMISRQMPQIGVSPRNPDFVAVAKGFGAAAEEVAGPDALPEALKRSFDRPGPTLLRLKA